MGKVMNLRTLGRKALLGAAALALALGAGAARAQETLDPVVREAITQVNRAAEGVERARREYAERALPLEERCKALGQEIPRSAEDSPERGLAMAKYLEAAARLSLEKILLLEKMLEALDALAPALEKLRGAIREREGGREIEDKESASRRRRMAEEILREVLRRGPEFMSPVHRTPLDPEKLARLCSAEDTLLRMGETLSFLREAMAVLGRLLEVERRAALRKLGGIPPGGSCPTPRLPPGRLEGSGPSGVRSSGRIRDGEGDRQGGAGGRGGMSSGAAVTEDERGISPRPAWRIRWPSPLPAAPAAAAPSTSSPPAGPTGGSPRSIGSSRPSTGEGRGSSPRRSPPA